MTMRMCCGFMLRNMSAYGAIGVSEILFANAVITLNDNVYACKFTNNI